MTKIISILIPLLVSCSVVNQKAHPSIRRECIDLLSVRIIVDIPIPIYFNKENYEEGVIYTYVFNDGVVFFHEGALMQFDIDTYPPFESVHTKNILCIGVKNMESFGKNMFLAIFDYTTTM